MNSSVPGDGKLPASATEPVDGEAPPVAASVPSRRNQMLAAGLAGVALIILAIVVTLMLLIRYESLPSLFSYLS